MRPASRRKRSDCSKCVHAIFDEEWGEIKCKVKQHRIYDKSKYANCKDYKKDAEKNSK